MEKTLTIDGKDVRFKSNGLVPLLYKDEFQRDFFKDVFNLGLGQKDKDEMEQINSIDFYLFYRVAYAFAKTADKSITNFYEWFESFEEFPIIELLPDFFELITATISSQKKWNPPTTKK